MACLLERDAVLAHFVAFAFYVSMLNVTFADIVTTCIQVDKRTCLHVIKAAHITQ